MISTKQNKTAAEQVVERILLNNKDGSRCQVLKHKNKNSGSIQVLYQPRSKRPEEHFFQYFT